MIILNSNCISHDCTQTIHIPHTDPPVPVQVTTAPTADGIIVSWRWNDSISSVQSCIRNLKIIYQHVKEKNKPFDLNKTATRFTLRGQQCNMGCTIIVRSVDVNGTMTDKECTPSGRTQIWPKILFTIVHINMLTNQS